MTVQEAKSKLVQWALAQVGYREGDNNYNRYAAVKEIEQIYGWDPQNEPWCDIFVDVGFVACFGLKTGLAMTYQTPGRASAACRWSANCYRANGAYFKTPEPGDQIFFLYDGGINHTGVVTGVQDGIVYTVEGNSSDMVARRSYALSSAVIDGYGRPNWALAASEDGGEAPAAEPPAAEAPAEKAHYSPYVYSVQTNLLRTGDRGPQVGNMQHLLCDHGFDCGGADGDFGPRTAAALRAFQTAAGIAADGEWGGESFRAMWNY